MANINKVALPNGDIFDIEDATARASIIPMTVLSYGNSTWNDFINAYNSNTVVYCRASSNSNPASGSQTRLAFMAYVNDSETPTQVEFQYYRSVSSHSDSQQGDQVYVYTLTSSGSWSVTVREAYTKIVAGTGLSSSYSNGALTLSSSGADDLIITYEESTAVGTATVGTAKTGSPNYVPSGDIVYNTHDAAPLMFSYDDEKYVLSIFGTQRAEFAGSGVTFTIKKETN